MVDAARLAQQVEVVEHARREARGDTRQEARGGVEGTTEHRVREEAEWRFPAKVFEREKNEFRNGVQTFKII